ncbi:MULTISPECIES: hypothetical protein [Pseudonocardia]|uniref:Secreted protein n=2 Tax=Pseudonocardia TaxID=1847 RepID=A0A1Y2MU17_PSEAH|nr:MULTISPECIES: hypothetical protein [Pseudonocardia]OSY38692.1 hypothetical protein BG845_03894 [Pseudonocardia autotrophica]TDN74894.1 hypothetical protein C8E95_4029 [Pseudonocardia autotrophica]BBF98833.1 hypothetical protein Pdca_00430 [Pseudonocardia autotrophica]GEC26551.1 hypothetical protein PSA01_35800 [Pseudonocardia saturnea]
MRKSIRIAAASALALPLALGVSGVAFADDDTTVTSTQETAGSATGAQSADVSQDNGSTAPVTQVNPAANADGIAGLSNFANEDVHGGSGQSVVQDNSIESSTEQGNAASVEQAQKTVLDQTAGLG